MKKLLLLALWGICSLCQAGTGYHVTFVNETDLPLTIEFHHKDGWYENDFGQAHTIQPHQQIELYTENKAKGPGVVGVRVSSGQYEGSQIEVWQNFRGSAKPPFQSTHSIQTAQTYYLRSLDMGGILEHNVGTNNPDIITKIRGTEDGFFNTAYATVIFPRFAAAASCEKFRVNGNIASGYCYNSGPLIERRYVEVDTAQCSARYGDKFNIDNVDGVLTCIPQKPPIGSAHR
jgi:hypothetical protein